KPNLPTPPRLRTRPPPLRAGGRCLCGPPSSAAGGRGAACAATVCRRAHGRRLCAAAARAWTPLCSGAAATGLLFARSRCAQLLLQQSYPATLYSLPTMEQERYLSPR
ncbi:hypothetical protein BHE74_00023168, partial [Ensete ventricosum]